MTKAHVSKGLSVLAMAWTLAANPALAQTAPAAAATAADTVFLEDIIVTAQKRAQNTVDVPISLAAINSDRLEALQISELRDFVGQVPSLVVNNFNARSDTVRLFIRGIGQNDVTLAQDPSVALYADGVYIGTTVGAGFESDDLERIEVLRGPQGTLYGRNATGGAVNLISAKPQTDRFHAKGSLSYGSYNAWRGTAMLNLPLGEKVALRISGLRTKRDGLVENTGLGRDFAEQDNTAFRAAIRFKPVDDLTIDYAYDNSLSKSTGTLTVPTAGGPASYPIAAPFPIPGTFGFATGITSLVNTFVDPAPFADRRPDSGRALRDVGQNRSKVQGHSLTIEYEASDALTLRSITGLRRINSLQLSDNLPTETSSIVTTVLTSFIPTLPVGTVLNVIGPNGVAYNSETTKFRSASEELQAIGKIGSAIEYVAGLYYYDDSATQNILNAVIGSGPLMLQNFTTVDNSSYAAFGELTFRPFADGKLGITLGGRYSHDNRAATRINERSLSFAAVGGFTADNCTFFLGSQALRTCTAGGTVQAANYKSSFNSFSPSITLAYKLANDMNLYAKYVRGYKSGGTSQRSANPINFAKGFQPEKVDSFEAGLKGNFLDRRLNATVAAFYMKLNKYQASLQTGATAGDRDFSGIDGNKIYGVEFDLTAALTRELRLSVSGSLLSTKFGATSTTVLLDTGQTQTQNFVSEFSYAPKSSGSINLDYNREIADGWDLGFHTNISYQGKTQTSSNLLDNAPVPSRALVDASLGITRALGEDHEVSLRFWGRNIFDKAYKTVSFGSFAFTGATVVSEFGEPRTYGLTLSVKY
jgi:iron complex outermembrane recepter protein